LVDLRGVGEGSRLGDDDVVVVRNHDLVGGRWFLGSRLGFGLRLRRRLRFGLGGWSWVADVTFTCAPGERDTFHEGVVQVSRLGSRVDGELVVVWENR
jgi:hypothetical protein